MNLATFTCARCGVEEPVKNGYASNTERTEKTCYTCCGILDAEYMQEHGRNIMYLVRDADGSYKVTNWPGTLSVTVHDMHKGRHNIAGTRYDVWFEFQGRNWHGVKYGENTEICRVRRSKES